MEFEATPGTYGAEFAAARKTSEVDEVEYEDVQDSQVIDGESVTGQTPEESDEDTEIKEPASTPTPTPDAEIQGKRTPPLRLRVRLRLHRS